MIHPEGFILKDVTGAIEFLTRPDQYALVYAKGSSHYSDLVVLRSMPNGLPLTRCGFSVGKKVGKAVVRNKVKRRLREIARLTPLKPGRDIVFIARAGAASVRFSELKSGVTGILTRARVIGDTDPAS